MLEVPRKRPKKANPRNLVKALAQEDLQDEVVFLLTKAKVQHLIRMIKTTGCLHLDVKEAPKEVQGEVQQQVQGEVQGYKTRKLRKFASRANCAITKNAQLCTIMQNAQSRKMRNHAKYATRNMEHATYAGHVNHAKSAK